MFHECKTKDEIKRLYRRLSSFLHPDKGGEADLMVLHQDAKDLALENTEEEECIKSETSSHHEKETDDVHDGDERLDIIEKILKYAETHKKFSTDFVESVQEYLDENGYITSSQYNALTRVYYSFRMDQEE